MNMSQSRPVVVLHLNTARRQWWLTHLQSLLPELEFQLWDEVTEKRDIRYAIVWQPPTGGLRQFTNLECIISVGAGIDHVLNDKQLPSGVPIIRTTGHDLTQRMREYVTLHVMRMHRRSMEIESQQTHALWQQSLHPPAYERRVGIMGQGKLGSDCARVLSSIGLDVAGWSRRTKQIDGITSFAGNDELTTFLQRTEILVCMLPLTEATRGILNTELFALLPHDACVINVARGEHLVDGDLIDALDKGHLAYATLDVFHTEPLPEEHAFWQHPKVLVTPHIASMIDPVAGGKEIARNLRDFINGNPVADMVDLKQGY